MQYLRILRSWTEVLDNEQGPLLFILPLTLRKNSYQQISKELKKHPQLKGACSTFSVVTGKNK